MRRGGAGAHGGPAGRSAWARCGVLACATAAAVLISARLLLASSASPARYDYIIVGGGATGSVVAGRLGEAGYSVLILEAGGPTQESLGGTDAVLGGKRTIFDVPLGWVQVLSDYRWSKEFQWNVPADPPPAIARGLGGCGIHNAMVYMRGRPEDFGRWGRGWGWEDVLPFYRKSEDNADFGNRSDHGAGGPVQVRRVQSDVISSAFVESARAAGEACVEDFNAATSRAGAGYYQFMIDRDGVRASAAAAFLGERVRPAGVTVRTHSHVSRLRLDEANRAVGVEVVHGPSPSASAPAYVVHCNHEVILSAGAVNTPKLLMLSGIGDSADLRRAGVTPLVHRPGVGAGLADGVYGIMQWETVGGDFAPCRIASPGERGAASAYCREQARRYARGEPSVFASPGMTAGAFLRSPHAVGEEPDVQLTLHPWDKYSRSWRSIPRHRRHGGAQGGGERDAQGDDGDAHDDGRGFATLEIANNRPRSRGRVSLRSSRFSDPPIFDGPYLRDVNDSLALRWAMRRVREIAAQRPLRDHLVAELVPGPHVVRTAMPHTVTRPSLSVRIAYHAQVSDAHLFDAIACGPRQFRSLGRPACDRSELAVNHLAGTCR